MTPRELIDELEKIVKVHPEAANHTIAAEDDEGHFPIRFLRYDKRRKRIILE